MSDPIDQYLARYAEPEARTLTRSGEWGHVLTVPAYGESIEDVSALLATVPDGPLGSALGIIVINARTDSNGEIRRANDDLRRWLRERPNLVVITRDTIPQSEGVGLARKIAADVALRLIRERRVASDWIHFTDADALLPPDYFRLPAEGEFAATTYPFRHWSPDPRQEARALAYECRARSYVTGLERAGSPYAFHTVGSSMAVRAHAYAAVRGVPRRNAAEDFYLLNKVAKTGPVLRLDGNPIRLQGRPSDRVPFGTGAALRALVPEDPLRMPLYDPGLFDRLTALIAAFARVADEPSLSLYEQLDDPVHAAASKLGVDSGIAQAAERARSPEARLAHMHAWFDGLRTLKLVNELRRDAYPDIELAEYTRRLGVNPDPRALASALGAV